MEPNYTCAGLILLLICSELACTVFDKEARPAYIERSPGLLLHNHHPTLRAELVSARFLRLGKVSAYILLSPF
jgi:hypothetical protein